MTHHIRLDLEIAFSSRWHGGSGESSLTTDRLIHRDSRNLPFIPASTLKGIIRQSCEKLSRTQGFAEPWDPHQRDLTLVNAFVQFSEMASPIDRLFGTNFEPGGLFFRDAHLKDAAHAGTFTRNRAARYRILNTARDQHLFSVEYSSPEVLCTRIDGRHRGLVSFDEKMPPFAYCLLIAGILAVERIGGDKSTGSGWLNGPIKLQRVEYNGSDVVLDNVFELLDSEDYLEMREES
ncbi:MAG: RAMP superfamily CRISPR-associated protein [Pseudomonadota bacterium]